MNNKDNVISSDIQLENEEKELSSKKGQKSAVKRGKKTLLKIKKGFVIKWNSFNHQYYFIKIL